MKGRIEAVQNIRGKIKAEQTLVGKISKPSLIKGHITIPNNSEADVYTGEYIVDALSDNKTILQTKNKLLKENVVVNKIKYYEVSNLDGLTVYIG